jgi:hypothetical protein
MVCRLASSCKQLVSNSPSVVLQANVSNCLAPTCRYRQRDGKLCLAKVVQVDRSIQPWGYGIELEGNPDIRFTEGNRLLPQQLSSECLQHGTCSQPAMHAAAALVLLYSTVAQRNHHCA